MANNFTMREGASQNVGQMIKQFGFVPRNPPCTLSEALVLNYDCKFVPISRSDGI